MDQTPSTSKPISKRRAGYWCNQWFSDIGWVQQNTTECRYISERVMEHTTQYHCPQIAEDEARTILEKAKTPGHVWFGCKVGYLGAKYYGPNPPQQSENA